MDYVVYNSEYQILICKEHKCGISPRRLDRHFRDEHKAMPMAARKELLTYAQELALCEPEHAPAFNEVRPAIHGLQIHNGYRCEHAACGFYTTTLNYIKRHSREHKADGWEGMDSKFMAVKIQTWFIGKFTRYGITPGMNSN